MSSFGPLCSGSTIGYCFHQTPSSITANRYPCHSLLIGPFEFQNSPLLSSSSQLSESSFWNTDMLIYHWWWVFGEISIVSQWVQVTSNSLPYYLSANHPLSSDAPPPSHRQYIIPSSRGIYSLWNLTGYFLLLSLLFLCCSHSLDCSSSPYQSFSPSQYLAPLENSTQTLSPLKCFLGNMCSLIVWLQHLA